MYYSSLRLTWYPAVSLGAAVSGVTTRYGPTRFGWVLHLASFHPISDMTTGAPPTPESRIHYGRSSQKEEKSSTCFDVALVLSRM